MLNAEKHGYKAICISIAILIHIPILHTFIPASGEASRPLADMTFERSEELYRVALLRLELAKLMPLIPRGLPRDSLLYLLPRSHLILRRGKGETRQWTIQQVGVVIYVSRRVASPIGISKTVSHCSGNHSEQSQ